MRPIRFLIITAFSLCSLTLSAQSAAQDTLAFRKYLGNTMSKYYALPTLIHLYKLLADGPHPANRAGQVDSFPRPFSSQVGNQSLQHMGKRSAKFLEFEEQKKRPEELLKWLSDLNTCGEALKKSSEAYHASYKKKSLEKKKLVQALTFFDSLSENKPIFFADIYGKFKGNISSYVDNLFRRSVLCSKRRMYELTFFGKRPEYLQKDPGVQFVIGLALYELWIKDVREGNVKDYDTANH